TVVSSIPKGCCQLATRCVKLMRLRRLIVLARCHAECVGSQQERKRWIFAFCQLDESRGGFFRAARLVAPHLCIMPLFGISYRRISGYWMLGKLNGAAIKKVGAKISGINYGSVYAKFFCFRCQ